MDNICANPSRMVGYFGDHPSFAFALEFASGIPIDPEPPATKILILTSTYETNDAVTA